MKILTAQQQLSSKDIIKVINAIVLFFFSNKAFRVLPKIEVKP